MSPQDHEKEQFDYGAWLGKADHAIEIGLNPNAVWRLHERVGRVILCEITEHDLGREC